MKVVKPTRYQHSVVCQNGFFNPSTGLEFLKIADGGVQTSLVATEQAQGYDGVMHGGMVSSLHDSAMVHTLFALNIHAMTVELTVRFIAPVPLYTPLRVVARQINQRRNVHYLESEIWANGERCSKATAKFIHQMLGAD